MVIRLVQCATTQTMAIGDDAHQGYVKGLSRDEIEAAEDSKTLTA
jgi:hypothetical protein